MGAAVGAGVGAAVGSGVGHGNSLHGKVSFVLPHSSPPCAASISTVRLRVFDPLPHSALHAAQSCQSPIAQSTGHACVLQSKISDVKFSSHCRPPCCSGSIVLFRYLCPPPQIDEQFENADQLPTTKSTGANVGAGVGAAVGASVGEAVGAAVGAAVNTPGHANSLQAIVSMSVPHSAPRSENFSGNVNASRFRVFVPPPHSAVQASHSCHGLGDEHSGAHASVLHSTAFTSVSFKEQSPPKIPPKIVRV